MACKTGSINSHLRKKTRTSQRHLPLYSDVVKIKWKTRPDPMIGGAENRPFVPKKKICTISAIYSLEHFR